MIRVALPSLLKNLVHVDGDLELQVDGPVTLGSVLDALESSYPALRGTLRDPSTRKRRALIRFFACEEDLSQMPLDASLPEAVATGAEPLLVVGAIAGG